MISRFFSGIFDFETVPAQTADRAASTISNDHPHLDEIGIRSQGVLPARQYVWMVALISLGPEPCLNGKTPVAQTHRTNPRIANRPVTQRNKAGKLFRAITVPYFLITFGGSGLFPGGIRQLPAGN